MSRRGRIDMPVFEKRLIRTNVHFCDKEELLGNMVDLLGREAVLEESGPFFECIMARERDMSTGLGRGVAFPHGRNRVVRSLKCAVYILDKDLDFDSVDERPVRLVFMFAVPEEMSSGYMNLLGAVSGFLAKWGSIERFLKAENSDEVYGILQEIPLTEKTDE